MTNKKNKKNNSDNSADHGTPEKHQHHIYKEIDTIEAGVKALRNVTADPLQTYRRRKSITQLQWIAGDKFAHDYRLACLVAVYSHVRFDDNISGAPSDEAAERIQFAKQRVRAAIQAVGFPLASVLTHVIGDGNAAGSWYHVRFSPRKQQDGMTAFRLALDGLVEFYKIN